MRDTGCYFDGKESWGIYLQTGEGVHFINYYEASWLDGYTLISNEEIGKFSLLKCQATRKLCL